MKSKIIYHIVFFLNSSSPDHRCCNYEQKIKTITTEATSVTTLATTTAESTPTTTLKPRPTTTRTSTRVPTTRTTTRVPTTRTTTRTTTTRTRTTTRKGLPVKANSVKVGDPPIVVKGLVVDEFG